MRSLSVLTVAFVLILAVTGSAQQTVNYVFPDQPELREISYIYEGGGARAFGMGGAFSGISDDVNSSGWNPAGMYLLESPILGISYSYYTPVGKASQQNPNLGISLSNNISKSLDGIGSFAFAAPARVKGHPFVFHFNYNRSNQFANTYDAKLTTGSNLSPDSYLKDEGELSAYNFGFSTRLYKQLAIGVTANIYNGQRVLSRDNRETRDSIVGFVNPDTIVVNEFNLRTDSTKNNGFNFSIGTHYRANKFAAGFVAHTPFNMRNQSVTWFDSTATANGLFIVDAADTVIVIDSLAKQQIPLSMNLGFAFMPSEKLTLGLDFRYQPYGGTTWYFREDFLIDASGDRTDHFKEYTIDWNDSYGFGLGAEYFWDTGIGRIPLRGGFRYDRLPQQEKYVQMVDRQRNSVTQVVTTDYSFSGEGNLAETGFSVGTGIHWALIRFDVAYQYTTGGKSTLQQIGTSAIVDDGTGERTELTSETLDRTITRERKSHEVRVSFTGYLD